MNRIADALVARRRVAASVGLVMVLVLLSGIRSLPVDGSLTGFEVPDNPHLSLAQAMAGRFSPPPVVQVAVEPAEATLREMLADLHAIDTAVSRAIPGADVGSLHSFEEVYEYVGLDLDDSIAAVLDFAASAPIARDLVSRDGQSFLIIVRAPVEPRPDPALLDEILARPYGSISATSVFGLAHLERDIRRAIDADVARLTLLILLCAVGFVLLAFRSARALVFVVALTSASAIGAVATQSLLGQSLDVATMLVVPTVVALSLADAVHLLTGFSGQDPNAGVEERLRSTVGHYLPPSFLTTLTTVVAFFSLLLSEAASLRSLGLACGIAVLLAFTFAYSLGPYLLDRLGVRTRGSPTLRGGLTAMRSRAAPVGVPLLFLIPIGLALFPGLNFSTPPDHFFPARSETTRVHDEMTARFYSLSTIDVFVTPQDPATLPPGPSLDEMLTDVSRQLEALPGVYSAVSVADVVTQGRALGIPSPVLVGLALDNPYTSKDGTAYRIEVRVDDASVIPALAERVEEIIAPYASRAEWSVTGITLALEYVNARVVGTLVGSFAMSTLGVVLVILGLTRTLRGTLIALAANLVPLAAATVAFSLLDLELSVLSATVLVLSMGLIDNETIHVLYRLHRTGELEELPYGMAVTSLVVAGCFALFLTSVFPPVRVLGGAIAGIMAVALVADLTLVPWLYGAGSVRGARL